MRRKALVPLLVVTGLLPANAVAVGLGSIEMNSALNQRLDAQIPLHGVTPGEADEVEIRLASERAFDDIDLPRPAFLSDLEFDVIERDNDVIVRVTSSERIREPYLSFLVEVDAPAGGLLREYTVLLDPPVYAEDDPEPEVDPAEEEVDVAEAPPEEEEPPPDVAEPEPEVSPADTYETRDGDTAWEIAARFAGDDVTVQQMMVALLRGNPEAFVDENINRLRSGYVLRIPSDRDVAGVDQQQAIAEIARQESAWQEWREQLAAADPVPEAPEVEAPTDIEIEAEDELRIVGAPDGGEVAAGEDMPSEGTAEELEQELQLAREQLESSEMERDELASRVSELESTVEQMERLISVREEQLLALQDRLVQVAEEGEVELDPEMFPDEEIVPDEIGVAEEIDIEVSTFDEHVAEIDAVASEREEVLIARAEEADALEEDEEDEAAVAAEDPEPAVDTGVETVRTQPEEEGLLSRLMAPLVGLAAVTGGVASAVPGGPLGLLGGAAALAALGALLVVRRRQQQQPDTDEDAVDLGDVELDDEQVGDFDDLISDQATSEPSPEEGRAAAAGVAAGADDSGLRSPEEESAPGDPASGDSPAIALDEDPSEDESEKDDTIAEADVYLAYGLHQQARELLELAVQESPARTDYREKLLETLYAEGDQESFETHAGQLRGLIDSTEHPQWQRVAAMGRDIAPSSDLFGSDRATPSTASSGTPGADSAGEDFEDLDFDLTEGDLAGTEPRQAQAADQQPGVAAAAPASDTGSATSGIEEDLEFDLADLEEADLEELGPEEPAEGDATEASSQQDDSLEFDIDDLIDDELGGAPEPPVETGAEKSSAAEPAATGEEDLDFDIDDIDVEPEASGASPQVAEGDAEAAASTDEFDLDDLVPHTTGEVATEEPSASQAQADDSLAPGADGEEPAFDLSELDDLAPMDDNSAADHGEPQAAAAGHGAAEGFARTDHADEQQTAPDEDLEGLDALLDDELALSDEASADRPEVPEERGPEASGASAGNGNGQARTDGDVSSSADEDGDDELDTMLDLARAYIDLGDQDSASSALEEVIAAGSEQQRAEARKLLDEAR